ALVVVVRPQVDARVTAAPSLRDNRVQQRAADALAPALGDDVDIGEKAAAGNRRTAARST
ncbi:MAG TPA: hypothetical protein VIF85_13780, partial [Gaiellaceae bacterium]